MTPDRSVTVDFEATRGGIDRMTWGQIHIWRPLQWFGEGASAFNVTRVIQLDEALPEEVVGRSLRWLVEHHQALRSHYRNGVSGPQQHIALAGSHEVAFVSCTPREVAATAEAVAAAFASRGFDLAHQWPVRFVFVGTHGVVRALVVVASHVAVDGWAMDRLLVEWRALMDGTRAAGEDWQPLDQAAFEASDEGRRVGTRALRHWRRNLATMPPTAFDAAVATADDVAPVQQWRLRSAAVAAAATTLAARTGTSASMVLLTVSALALRALTGHDPAAVKLIAANRFTPRLQTLVAPVAQDGLFVLPIGGGDVVGTIRRAYPLATRAYYHGQVDPDALEMLTAEVERERGIRFDLSAYFNDARRSQDWTVTLADDVSRATLDRLRAGTWLDRTATFERHDMKFCVSVKQEGDMCVLFLLADTRYLPVEMIQAVLRGIETVLCEALLTDVDVDRVAELIDSGRE